MRRAWAEAAVAAAAMAAAWALYRALAPDGAAPSTAVGHGFGIAGAALMLWAELGHSLRKRAIHRPLFAARWSLAMHVVAGLVGPALVLLHTGWRFRGLAGAVTVMTLVVVASGVTGRFVYGVTAAPGGGRRTVAAWNLVHVPLALATVVLAAVHAVGALYFSAGIL